MVAATLIGTDGRVVKPNGGLMMADQGLTTDIAQDTKFTNRHICLRKVLLKNHGKPETGYI